MSVDAVGLVSGPVSRTPCISSRTPSWNEAAEFWPHSIQSREPTVLGPAPGVASTMELGQDRAATGLAQTVIQSQMPPREMEVIEIKDPLEGFLL